ncbi:aminotransferase [Oceanobacillus profundus]|uniref:Aminotransferase n=1 Tax=Oceanobacillus profundus TaxID=372463 RepID=A0A417YB23_9BACI|nr:aminotransferase [Oceanobacillus profundus]MBR3119030.1 aminotransferase [Oceanobacillus sp.]PAE30784.1 aromatic amino acid aminotransferase [Paenibacillus sp. 7884-2]MCM3398326.1 aminotransferase [Oceanobacillus profundus]MDO6451852.1 aminotransferase [Oceanobacillus profundus]RHW29795.1 aminotransferase [Oceanobacillus profundus]
MSIDFQNYLSTTAKGLEPSGIRKFFDLAASMEDVISLGVGEPDFVTPWNIREATIEALKDGHTSYTANAGLLELRQEISNYLKRNFKLSYQPEDQVIVTVGASQSLDLAFRAILNPGDEVLIIEPAFVSYTALVTLAGGIPVRIATYADNDFKVTPEQLEAAITDRTKAILLCSPSNPTGSCLNRAELTEIAQVVEKHDLLVVTDEIYAELSYDEEFTSFAAIPGMYDRTIVVNGFSKGFAMTGWRLGFLAAPREFIQVMVKIYQFTTMCAPTMLQLGALEALRNSADQVEKMRQNYWRRRNFMVQSLRTIGLDCHTPGGAFYVFPSIQKTGLTSEEFAARLLQEEKVAVVPGNAFGASGEGYIRCSYAASIEQLETAMKRIGRFIQSLELKEEKVLEKVR